MGRFLRVTLAILSALVAAALAACGRSSPAPEAITTAEADSRVAFFLPTADGARLVRREVVASAGEDPLIAAVRALTNAPGSPVPSGTVVRSVDRDGSTAVLNLSRAFVAGYPQGAAAEGALIGALVATATARTGVAGVRLRVEGERPDPVGAQLDLSGPLTRADVPLPIVDER